LRKRIKPVTVKGLSLMQNVWILHSKHIGRLASAVRCVRDTVNNNCGHIDRIAVYSCCGCGSGNLSLQNPDASGSDRSQAFNRWTFA
jgi:hypothetical protein